MKNYTDSDYALNKYSEGIVYRFADGVYEITLADFLAENPDMTEADFRKLKEYSDANYREQDRRDNAQTKKNSPFDALENADCCCEPSAEYSIVDEPEEFDEARKRDALAEQALNKLTEVQRRRYLMHVVDGLTTREIAGIEGVNQSKISKSLAAAKKKIKKVLANT